MRSLGQAASRLVQKLEAGEREPVSIPIAAPRRRRATQELLGLVAPALKPVTPSQREMVRRAGTYLSIQQQRARRRAR